MPSMSLLFSADRVLISRRLSVVTKSACTANWEKRPSSTYDARLKGYGQNVTYLESRFANGEEIENALVGFQ